MPLGRQPAALEILLAEIVAEGLPLAAGATAADRSVAESVTQPCKKIAIQPESGAGFDRQIEQAPDIGGGVTVPAIDARFVAMGLQCIGICRLLGIGQPGSADIVGSGDDNDLFPLAEPGDEIIHAGNEAGRVTTPRISQHTKKMMRPQPDHGSGFSYRWVFLPARLPELADTRRNRRGKGRLHRIAQQEG